MKSRPSARLAKNQSRSVERAKRPGNRLSAKACSQAPSAGKMDAVLSGGPDRSEFRHRVRGLAVLFAAVAYSGKRRMRREPLAGGRVNAVTNWRNRRP